MRTRTVAALTICLLAASVAVAAFATGAGATPVDPAPAGGPSPGAAAAAAGQDLGGDDTGADSTADAATVQAAPDEDFARRVTIEFRVRPNGDARVVVRKTYSLDSESGGGAFEQVREDFTDGDLQLGAVHLREVVDDVASGTNRSMTATGVERYDRREDGVGVLEEQFTWRNFGNATGERVVVEDAFYTEDGPWLPVLSSGQRLVLRSPEDYSVEVSRAGVVGGDSVVWEVEHSADAYVFTEGEYRTVFVRDEPAFGLQGGLLFAVGVGLIGAGLLAYLVFRRYDLARREPPAPAAPGAEPAAEAAGDGSGAEAPSADGDAGAAAAGAAGSGGDGDDVDPELLSDEERVERLLERNGGRMKQANIVDETGWSNAKVSQLLSEMAEEDRVDKLRIGRENLITLPDEDVTATE